MYLMMLDYLIIQLLIHQNELDPKLKPPKVGILFCGCDVPKPNLIAPPVGTGTPKLPNPVLWFC